MLWISEADWQRAAEHFGVAAEDVPHYQQAFAEIGAMGINAFADALEAELLTARSAVPAPADVVRRLVIRKTVLVEVFGFVAHEALINYQGPEQ